MALSWKKTLGAKFHQVSGVTNRRICLSSFQKQKRSTTNTSKNEKAVLPKFTNCEEDAFEKSIQSTSTLDTEFEAVPVFLKLNSSRTFSCSTILPDIFDVSIPDVTDPTFETIMTKKLQICNEIYSFNDPALKPLVDKKTSVLQEIVSKFDKGVGLQDISLNIQKAIFETIYKNIFEQNPKFPEVMESWFYTVQIVDPMWPHLSLCFSILLSFTTLFPHSKLFTNKIVRRAIYLTNLPDVNVRSRLLQFLKILLEKRVDFYNVMMKASAEQLQNVVAKIIPPYCTGTLLRVLKMLFQRSNMRPPAEFHDIIHRTVLPLLSSPFFQIYDDIFNDLIVVLLKPIEFKGTKGRAQSIPDSRKQMKERVQTLSNDGNYLAVLPPLKNCGITQVSSLKEIKKSPTKRLTVDEVIVAVNQYWPRTNSQKEVSMLKTLCVILNNNALGIDDDSLSKMCAFVASLLLNQTRKTIVSILNYINEKPLWMKWKPEIIIENFLFILTKLKNKEKEPEILEATNKAIQFVTSLDQKFAVDATILIPPFLSDINNEADWMRILSMAENNYHNIDSGAFSESVQEMLQKGRDISRFA